MTALTGQLQALVGPEGVREHVQKIDVVFDDEDRVRVRPFREEFGRHAPMLTEATRLRQHRDK